jgi:hypothetical protein
VREMNNDNGRGIRCLNFSRRGSSLFPLVLTLFYSFLPSRPRIKNVGRNSKDNPDRSSHGSGCLRGLHGW